EKLSRPFGRSSVRVSRESISASQPVEGRKHSYAHAEICHDIPEGYEQVLANYEKELVYNARWIYLMTFSKFRVARLITETMGEDLFLKEGTFMATRRWLEGYAEEWKGKALEAMMQVISNEAEPSMMASFHDAMTYRNDYEGTFAWFIKGFTPEKCFTVFHWARDLVNYEKCSPYGKWFLQHAYATLGMHVMDFMTIEAKRQPAFWDGLQVKWDQLGFIGAAERGDFADKRAGHGGANAPKIIVQEAV
ncbi:hypothetical protein KEM55_008588, partial [Ascosphaera atra]